MTLVFTWLFCDPEDLRKHCFRQFYPSTPTPCQQFSQMTCMDKHFPWMLHGTIGIYANTRISLQNIVLQWYDEC